jgi:integrase
MTWPKAGHGDGAGESKGGKSAPGRAANSAYRSREHLTPEEVEALIRAARGIGRYGHRDATAILLAYRHGLRASELCELRREQVDLDRGELHVRRLKSGKPSTHPIPGDEMRALRKLLKDVQGPYVFATERGGPLDRSGFLKIVRRAGELRGFHSQPTRTCCGTLRAITSRTGAPTHGPSKTTSGTGTSSTPSATQNWLRGASGGYGTGPRNTG